MTTDGLTRREVLQLLAASGVGALAGERLLAKAPSTLGVQIYTVRDQFAKDPDATIKAIADIGYKEIELVYGDTRHVGAAGKEVRPRARQHPPR